MSIQARFRKDLPPFQLEVELEAKPGITVLLGPSGSGKTLTLNCLAGFVTPDEGRIVVDEHICFDRNSNICLPPQQRRCGYLFQDHALFPHMTVRNNLRFAAASQKRRGLETRRRINELLDAFELSEFADRKPAHLSGGQQQRAAIARMLIGEPRFILLDEPTQGLDVRLRESFYEIVRETRKRLNVPLILVTHDLDECFALANQVYLMEAGRFLQSGLLEDVFRKPANLAAARFLGLFLVLPAEIRALDPGRNTSVLRIGDSELNGPYFSGRLLGDRGFVCVRTSEVSVAAPTPRARELVLPMEAACPGPGGTRIRFAGGASITVRPSEFETVRELNRLALLIPPSAVLFMTE